MPRVGSPQYVGILDNFAKKVSKMCLHVTGDVPENVSLTSADVVYLDRRREAHILNFMHKNKEKDELMDMKNGGTKSFGVVFTW